MAARDRFKHHQSCEQCGAQAIVSYSEEGYGWLGEDLRIDGVEGNFIARLLDKAEIAASSKSGNTLLHCATPAVTTRFARELSRGGFRGRLWRLKITP